jgi:hypothetical protein
MIICVVWWQGQQYEERIAVDILASHDSAELGMRVFAQFIVTQKMFLKYVVSATRLVVPVYFPEASEWMQIDLLRNDQLVQRWRSGSGFSDEIINVEFEIEPTQLLDGELEIVFSAVHIDHDNKGRAPRIFIEKSDANYPDGNYRVADNEKEGDVGLTLYERNRRWELWFEKLLEDPLRSSAFVVRGVLVVMLIIFLPQVLMRSLKVDSY